MELRATIEGRCVPWQRTASYQGRKLTTKKQREYQRLIRQVVAMSKPPGWPMDALYAVEIILYAHPKQRFDLDNAAKQFLDSSNKLVWNDDHQVRALAVVKRLDRERPRVEVCVVPLEAAEHVDVMMTIGGAA